MQKLYSIFPGGSHGIGLLILRIAAGVAAGFFGGTLLRRPETAMNSQISFIGHLILSLLLISGSIFLILGLMMPFISITMAVCELTAAYLKLALVDPAPGSGFSWIALLLLASIAIALFFLGPGAYSIDSRLFGRRRIFIPSSKKEERLES